MEIQSWVEEIAGLCQPKGVYYCDGSEEEYRRLCNLLVQKKTFVPLKRPNSFWCHSTPDDVARSEANTFICSLKEEDAGPTNNWKDPKEMREILKGLFRGCMRGRTLYVIPFCMGPLNSPYSRFGVQITDSPYVVCNMKLMTRMGKEATDAMQGKPFVPCLHSVGMPLEKESDDVPWPNNPKQKYIVQFPDEPSIWSFGSGYGGNALLSKKCFALRIASVLGEKQGWLAEHMLLIGVTNPAGEKKYITASFPSSCGKTNLAMLQSILPGWTIDCIGDDICWLHIHQGQLYGINPENGFFGVAPGTSEKTNPVATRMIEKNTIFTNTALTADHDVWWEGLTDTPPENLISWQGKPWDKTGPASHPNARFTIQASNCSMLSPEFNNPQGVPISAIIFGGRRSKLIPLVVESLSWNHGVLLGASMSSEMTAAAEGQIGKLRHDPFAMLPFCGYNMGDYFKHWMEMGKNVQNPPRIFHVNWFRKDDKGHYIWPGFRQNIHVLKWIFERVGSTASAKASPVGNLPPDGLFPAELTEIDTARYLEDAAEMKKYFSIFGSKMPTDLLDELEQLQKRLKNPKID
jgi:phosphoenolpyruvate carboxykinase (GTP)